MALPDEDKQWLLKAFERFATKEDLERVEAKVKTNLAGGQGGKKRDS